ncbi:MAG: hypothetical protein QM796_09295 [Chthoniobacteraceae bacterium]
MRFLAAILLLSLSLFARAQQQESRMDQILNWHPDHGLENDMHKKFEGEKSSEIGKKFETKGFQFSQHSFDKTFTTSDFAGTKQADLGNRVFATKSANETTEKVIPNVDTKYAVKKADVKESSDSHKVYATSELDQAHREYLGPESKKMHTAIDQNQDVGWQGKFDVMTVDQVRTLLNKNK